MPWCPKCKMEYVEGKTTCADCGSDLVDELEETSELFHFLETEKEKFAKKFVEFLHYSNVPTASYIYEEETKQWIVLIEESTKKQVRKLYDAFYSVEAKKVVDSKKEDTENEEILDEETTIDSEIDSANQVDEDSDWYDDTMEESEPQEEYSKDSDSSEDIFAESEIQGIFDGARPKPVESSTYVKKEEQFRDLKSSASTFIFVSIAGIAVLILNLTGIISIFSGIMTYLVMGALFIIFLIIGITSYQKSKSVEKEIATENNLTDSIQDWLTLHVTKEQLNSYIDTNASEEIQFLHRLDKMKEMIQEEFGNLDEKYLDRITEEYYNSHFEDQME